jgi:ATP-binding cassette subfamily C protein LapB
MTEKSAEAPLKDWNLGQDTDAHDDPLLDCLIQLTKIHGRPASRTALSAGLPLVRNCLTVELFSRAADRADLASRVLKKPLGKIAHLQLPVVLLLHDRQACVLVENGAGGNQLKILLPETGMGEKILSREELGKLYTGYAIFVRQSSDREESVDDLSQVRQELVLGDLFKSRRPIDVGSPPSDQRLGLVSLFRPHRL